MQACERYSPGDPKCVCVVNAIATQDSAWGTAGIGKKTNNVCNVRPLGEKSPIPHEIYHAASNGDFASFSTIQDGIDACVDLYARRFAGKMPDEITRIWAGNPESKGYWQAISACF